MEFVKYNHLKEEKKISDYWIKNNCFKPRKKKSNKKFSVVIPPPNITGRLHMGHALNNSLQDVLVRFNRMKGLETLWQPGTDHAGIATQAIVENNLSKEGLNKNVLGRERFIKKVWKWKEESGGIILDQLKKLGCSCDWSRTRFTMDKDLSKAVIKVFVDLYKKKLIYKDKKLVNWDTKLQTAISDLEVVQRDVQSQLYYIEYPIENSENKITIATTRPETMMGDAAIAVNPKDDRYKNLIGSSVKIPLVNRIIKIIADHYADPEQGSGAVKITPAHDFNDYDVGKRNKLEIINILEKNGTINKNGIKEFIGLDRFEARKLLIKKLKENGHLVKIESIKNKVPYGDRSNTIVEPLLTKQWFVDAKKLSKKPIKIVKDGKTTFYPENWSKTFFQWTALDALKGAAPLARYGHSAGLLSGRYYTIFGGYVATKSGASNDVVAIDLGATDDVGNNCADAATAPGQECEWVKPMPMGTEPLPRQYAASTVIGKKGSRGNNKMVIFGGCGVPSKVCYNDAYVLRVTKQGWYWQQTDVDDDQIPERREAGTLTYIPSTVHFTSLANAFAALDDSADSEQAPLPFARQYVSQVAIESPPHISSYSSCIRCFSIRSASTTFCFSSYISFNRLNSDCNVEVFIFCKRINSCFCLFISICF